VFGKSYQSPSKLPIPLDEVAPKAGTVCDQIGTILSFRRHDIYFDSPPPPKADSKNRCNRYCVDVFSMAREMLAEDPTPRGIRRAASSNTLSRIAVPSLMGSTRNRTHVMSNNLFTFVLIAAALAGLAYMASSLVSPFQ